MTWVKTDEGWLCIGCGSLCTNIPEKHDCGDFLEPSHPTPQDKSQACGCGMTEAMKWHHEYWL